MTTPAHLRARFATMKPPRFADDDEGMAFTARLWLQRRQEAYPRAIAAKQLTDAQAAEGLRVAAAVARLWTSIDERHPSGEFYEPDEDWFRSEGASGATYREMFAALALAADRAAELVARDPTSRDKRDDADCLLALAWHHRPDPDLHGAPHRLVLAKVSARLRADARQRLARAA